MTLNNKEKGTKKRRTEKKSLAKGGAGPNQVRENKGPVKRKKPITKAQKKNGGESHGKKGSGIQRKEMHDPRGKAHPHKPPPGEKKEKNRSPPQGKKNRLWTSHGRRNTRLPRAEKGTTPR